MQGLAGITLTDEVILGVIFLVLGYPVSVAMSHAWGYLTGRAGIGGYPLSEKEEREHEARVSMGLLLVMGLLVLGGLVGGVFAAIMYFLLPGTVTAAFVWAAVGMEYLGLGLVRLARPHAARAGAAVGERFTRLVTEPSVVVPPGAVLEEERDAGERVNDRPP
jgi:hypothetical protein